MRNIFTLFGILITATSVVYAQDERIASTSSSLTPSAPTGKVVSFSIKAEGKRFSPLWGLDQAWISEQNFRKGLNHMGRENVGIGRSCFRTTKALTNDTDLQADQTNALNQRNRIFNILSDTLPLVLTCDQEAGVDSYYRTGSNANVERWSAMINAHVKWLTENTRHRVAGVSPFNEPDYWKEEGATATNSRDIARKLKTDYPLFKNVAIVGSNTLNDDKAISWYTPGKAYYDWGNTHQLAGSMDNYKAFHRLLASEGKVGYNDEMHNVAEAFIGLEYGMTVGIWWGFDSRARGEFCDISRHGVRLGYAEHPANWTAATVYRHDDGRVKAFLGSSERQAYTTNYQFVSTDREVYYDGVGPTREILLTIHGGTGYQNGQKNAEQVIDITWGEDVQPSAINGTYKIMNKATRYVIAEHGSSGNNVNISQVNYNGGANQQWVVAPVGSSVDGDYSFYNIKSVKDGKFMDVLNFSTQSGGDVISFGSGTPSTNQQWYLEYAGDGYYYIRNRESALYLTLSSTMRMQGININQQTKLADPARQLWRFLPLDAECETVAPTPPAALKATAQSASILLEWEASPEDDVDGYILLRADAEDGEWNTIARKVKSTKFLDNSCKQGHRYAYRVKAIDRSENQSEPCEAVEAATTGERAMIARWNCDDNMLDETGNQLDAAFYGNSQYLTTNAEGSKALNLNGSSNYLQLPYEIASSDELTLMAWVNWRNATANDQRLFDFGNGAEKYMYLTPSNGNGITYYITDGQKEQSLQTPYRLTPLRWQHVALTLSRDSIVIYVDGEKQAIENNVAILPSDIAPCLNYIARGQTSSAPMLRAYIDDVRVFNYALTAGDVKKAIEEATGIMPSRIDETDSDTRYYNLKGMRMTQPASKGVYIRKNGKNATKTVVK